MKNKNEKCCVASKMSGTNIFVGILIGVVVLVFGGKIFLSQNPVPESGIINGTIIDKTLNKKTTNKEAMEIVGTWKSEDNELIINEDGSVVSDLGVITGSIDGDMLSMTSGEDVVKYTINIEENVLTLTSGDVSITYNRK